MYNFYGLKTPKDGSAFWPNGLFGLQPQGTREKTTLVWVLPTLKDCYYIDLCYVHEELPRKRNRQHSAQTAGKRGYPIEPALTFFRSERYRKTLLCTQRISGGEGATSSPHGHQTYQLQDDDKTTPEERYLHVVPNVFEDQSVDAILIADHG